MKVKNEKIELTLGEALNIRVELIGDELSQIPEDRKGLLHENIKPIIKFKLNKVLNQIETERLSFEKVREELINKYGKEVKGGGKSIDPKTDPESFNKFREEIFEILKEKVFINFTKINVEHLDFESNKFYKLVFDKFLKDA